jgi:hypothetical protein
MAKIICEYCNRPNELDAGECGRCGAPLPNVKYVPSVSKPFFVLKSQRTLSTEELARIREQWEQMFSGANHKLMILDKSLDLDVYSLNEARQMAGLDPWKDG